jgi:VWFA-related protein
VRRPSSSLYTSALAFCLAVSLCAQSAVPTKLAAQSVVAQAQQDPILIRRPPPKPATPPSVVTPGGRIHLDVVVTDSAGKPVQGLEPGDFKLLDNDQPGRILSFHSFDGVNVKPDPAVEVILVFDIANLPFQQVAFVRTEVERFLRQNGGHLAHPVSIYLLSEAGLQIQPRPSVDGNALVTVLNQIKVRLQTTYAVEGADADLRHFELSVRQIAAIAENRAKNPGRKLLVWLGPGWPMVEGNNYQFTAKDQKRYFDAIVELSTKLREARMAVYSVSPTSPALGAGPDRRFLYRVYLKGVKSAQQADSGDLALKVQPKAGDASSDRITTLSRKSITWLRTPIISIRFHSIPLPRSTSMSITT